MSAMNCVHCGTSIAEPEDPRCPGCGRLWQAKASDTPVERDTKTIRLDAVENPNFEDPELNRRFRILKRLGRGGMGVIYQARDLKLKRTVAIKSISTSTLIDESSRARFLREAQTASQLEHPNICTIYEIYEEEKNNYIVMQYVDGVTLDQIIDIKSLGLGKILDIAIQICDGMIAAHAKEIIHRDLKPGNIMVNQDGVVKILDFGLAKFRDESREKKRDRIDSTHLTEKGMVMGTVSYMSPEQARGEPLDFRSDIFSFAVTVYEMLEGKNPFQDENAISTLYNVLNRPVKFSRSLPATLKRCLNQALSKDRDHRPRGFADLREALGNVLRNYRDEIHEPKVDPETEVISSADHERMLEEVKRSSDQEGLGDIVYRIQKLKAQTRPLLTTRKRRLRRLALPLALLIGVVLVSVILWQKGKPSDPGRGESFYLVLMPFENLTRDKDLGEKLDYLLGQALNQFTEFKTLTRRDLNRMEARDGTDRGTSGAVEPRAEQAKPGSSKGRNLTLDTLQGRFPVHFRLTGTIRELNNLFNIDAVLTPVEPQGKSYSITMPVIQKDILLSHQIDTLVKRVYFSIFGSADAEHFNPRRVADIFGNRWVDFSNFYTGWLHFIRLESRQAEQYLLQAGDSPAARYMLADLYYFNGQRQEAMSLIEELVPRLDLVTDSLKYKVLALRARLHFDFVEEVRHLKYLQEEFPFSREGFYELGEAYFHHGQAQRAVEYYRKALELDPGFSKAINHLAYCHSYLGDHNRAIQLFEEYRNLDQSANSFDSLGDGYFHAGDLVSAQAMKLAALSKDEQSVPYSLLTLADIHVLKAQFEPARDLMVRYRKLRPQVKFRARALAKEAYYLWLLEDGGGALSLLNESLATYDTDDINEDSVAEAHWLRGWLHASRGETGAASEDVNWLRRLIERYRLSQDNFFIPFKYYLHLSAIMAERSGDHEACDAAFNDLVAMKTQLSYWVTLYNYPFFCTEYARYLIRVKEYERALSVVQDGLRFNSEYPPALWLLAEILERDSREKANEIYTRIATIYGESPEENTLRRRLRQKIQGGS